MCNECFLQAPFWRDVVPKSFHKPGGVPIQASAGLWDKLEGQGTAQTFGAALGIDFADDGLQP